MGVRSAALAVAACTGLAACAGSPPDRAPAPSAEQLYVDPSGAAAAQVRAWEAEGRTADAAAVRRIADAPTAVWFADAAPGFAERARGLVAAAAAAGRTPVLVAYYVPERDCGGHSGGGAPDAAAYRDWIAQLAAAVGGSPALVVLEPDAVTHVLQGCLSEEAAAQRYALLGEAVRAFGRKPAVRVYLDGGNPGWVKDVDRVVEALRRAGIADADGFSLNVANFETTEANIGYGTAISDRLGGTHFVIDTSRNGNGPATTDGDGDGHWCNPPGRALGPAPTTRTGHERVDAYLWVKRPGESDGACGAGAPQAGQWWPEYALGLATN
ncbi:glycoside hydrolase family 6 protein [Actinoplanes teichomyceticus]|uniref:Glucanase n=1 Tax=Actinoplanes teichomyceticus TaxID=1867 RepID=A0A561WAI7_ACTTI|nr:glycoside hydrolase family 6 protein [Actinoplanes teichomyceticus]TWG20869.1 endoglucanase [Actinoplanes teichomyceticus]GIF14530.1 glucanase [Actinoplanes teichomyceticus]